MLVEGVVKPLYTSE